MKARKGIWAVSAFTVGLALLAAAPALAQTPLANQNAKLRVGLNLVPMPFGTIEATAGTGIGTFTVSSSTAFAFGVFPYADYMVRPNFFVGIAPQFTFNVKNNSSSNNSNNNAARQTDFLVRLGANAPIADTIQLYGYIAPGYSIISAPNLDNAKGFVLGFHGGAMLDLTSQYFVNGELGYQFGYQSINDNFDFRTEYFQFGFGAGMRL